MKNDDKEDDEDGNDNNHENHDRYRIAIFSDDINESR